jgi:hypothetical protein
VREEGGHWGEQEMPMVGVSPRPHPAIMHHMHSSMLIL